jgi:acetyl-CoA carboxylase carboxyltransferase component
MGKLFKSSSTFKNNLVSIFLRKGYGLGAQAIVGGSLHKSTYTCAWPSGEFGGMGLEGAVKLGYKKELEAISDQKEKEILYNKLVDKMYEAGQAMEAASYLEIDAVIDPSKTRETIIKAQHLLK